MDLPPIFIFIVMGVRYTSNHIREVSMFAVTFLELTSAC